MIEVEEEGEDPLGRHERDGDEETEEGEMEDYKKERAKKKKKRASKRRNERAGRREGGDVDEGEEGG